MSALYGETQFVDAAACGDLDEVKALLASAEPLLTPDIINKVDKDGKSAFHYGCLNDDANLLKILLADSRVDVVLTSRNGDSGLHMAALYCALEAIALLVADGRLSLNAPNKYGETALHLVAGSGDKGGAKTANLLLDSGASLAVADKWNRGPMDVSHDNAENPIVATFTAYLSDRSRCSEEQCAVVQAMTTAYKAANAAQAKELTSTQNELASKNKAATISLFGALGGVKLKKTNTVLKTMFKPGEGKAGAGAAASSGPKDVRRALSKLVDFPGDLGEIRQHLENREESAQGVNPAGADAFGLAAIHKFASWNKTDYLDLLLPYLSTEQLNCTCPEGKTALHYAAENASVAAMKALIAAGIDKEVCDAKGRTVRDILDGAAPSGVIDRLKNALE
jgi:ankyrin repeat protein